MNFFECDTAALHLPHMQNFDGVYDAKIDGGQHRSFRDGGGPPASPPLAADPSVINASSLTVKAFSICRMIIRQKLLCASLYPLCISVTYEQFEWLVCQSGSYRFLW